MSQASAKRTSLLIGCGSAALALGLILGPVPAAAQGIQATGNVTFGNATIDQTVPGQTTVEVSTRTTVIDWTPNQTNGNALDFLPTGAFAFYNNSPNSQVQGNYAVLNRILPATNGNVAVINGSVISQIFLANGASSVGGFVAFYSPTGILVGSNAFFDVGQLMLTTLDTTPASFDQFAQNGFGLQLQAVQGSRARIQIQPGAQIQALADNAFFAVVAADVEMRGSARVNGSHAYVAGEVVNLSFDNGLFSIQVPVGTAASGEVLTLDGTISGPARTGAGDNHMIYAVARAAADPISMLLRGNLGFDPAQSASVVNGEIIISANYDVFGRFVDGGSIADGANATFNGNSELTGARADIDIVNATVRGDMLAIGTHRVTASANGGNSLFSGNLILVGRQNAQILASGNNGLTVTGDVLVDSRDYGASGSFLQSLDAINAQAGAALIEATSGGVIALTGRTRVLADAFAGSNTNSRVAGFARAGTAAISGNGGTVTITGPAEISAAAIGAQQFGIRTGAESRGGTAELRARGGGEVTVRGALAMSAAATGADGDTQSLSSVSNTYGGTARISVLDGGGRITVTDSARLNASARAGGANAASGGAIADAGDAIVSVLGAGQISISGTLDLDATARGGLNGGGQGGTGLGGRALATVPAGGTISITGNFTALATGTGGGGQSGGDGLGGIAGGSVGFGNLAIESDVVADASGEGGDAIFGNGGNGGTGRGGNAFLQANGTLTQRATIDVTGSASISSVGIGGRGGDSDGQAIAAGRGGEAYGGQFNVPNQADAAFTSGAFLLAGGDNGAITIGGTALVSADAFGGIGGGGAGTFVGGAGGNGFGGLAQVGLSLLGLNGSLGLGIADFADVTVSADAIGGRSGLGNNDFATGVGGNGTGGAAVLTLRAGDVTAGLVALGADGTGGAGAIAGTGTGGAAAVLGSLGGTLVTTGLFATANGFGGDSNLGTAGKGFGGTAEVELEAATVTINGNALLDASGFGGLSEDGAGGDGTGGEAYVGSLGNGGPGNITVTGNTQILATGRGGDSLTGFAAGNGQGGTASVAARAGSIKSFGTLQLAAVGFGGVAEGHLGGNGTGGTVEVLSTGTGSRITVARNVPAALASESPGGAAFLNASGFGEAANGGSGIGGTGQGGAITVTATQGGAINLPVNILADPLRAADQLLIYARGFGGGSAVDGGTGGAGIGGNITMLLNSGTLLAGPTIVSALGQGGEASDSFLNISGGNGNGGRIRLTATNSTLTLSGSFDLIANGSGGTGRVNATGGRGVGGEASVTLTETAMTVNPGAQGAPGRFAIRADGSGGFGGTVGNASGGVAKLEVVTGALTTGQLLVSAQGSSLGFAGQDSGTANGGVASIRLSDVASGGGGGGSGNASGGNTPFGPNGPGRIDASTITITSSAVTGPGGRAVGGLSSFDLSGAGTVQANANDLFISADASGGDPTDFANTAGAFSINATGGNLNLVRLTASARGDSLGLDPVVSRIVARGGNVNVTNELVGFTFGDLLVQYGTGGIIGSAGTGQTATLVQLDTRGTLTVQGDGGANGGLGGRSVDLLAGRSILVNGTINASTGGVNLTANRGGGQPLSPPQPSVIQMASGARINGGTGAVTIRLLDGAGDPQRATGAITLANITAGRIDARNFGSNAGSNITVLADGALTASGTGRAIDLASLNGEVINLRGDAGLVLTGGGHFGIFAATPTGSQIGSPANFARRYNVLTAAAYDALNPGGNFAAFRISPVLTVTADNLSVFYGTTNPAFTASITGFLPGDSIANLAGVVQFLTSANGTSPVGQYTLNVAQGTLVSSQGYQFSFAPGILNITPRPITVTASNLSRIYGNANPALGFTVGGQGLVNGDQLTGSLATAAGLTTGVGNFAITQGSLAASSNYALTFVAGQLTITPRPITITAGNFSRVYGDANPAFTFTLGGQGLVNGDQLSGALATAAGPATGVGRIAITQGTLTAGSNYAITFVNGQLTITPRPLTVVADNLSKTLGLLDPLLTFLITSGDLVNGDRLTGNLVRDPGETIASFLIRQGTLTGGDNYTITFVPGTFTINPPPASPALTNSTVLEPPLVIGELPPPIAGEEEERFGIDFPEQPDAPLISEDPLLDDPVASGSDSSLYGGSAAAPAPKGDQ